MLILACYAWYVVAWFSWGVFCYRQGVKRARVTHAHRRGGYVKPPASRAPNPVGTSTTDQTGASVASTSSLMRPGDQWAAQATLRARQERSRTTAPTYSGNVTAIAGALHQRAARSNGAPPPDAA